MWWVAYSGGYNYRRQWQPVGFTIMNQPEHLFTAFHQEQARQRGLYDKWEPELTLQLGNNHSLLYTGEKALKLWDAWNRKIFSKMVKQQNSTRTNKYDRTKKMQQVQKDLFI